MWIDVLPEGITQGTKQDIFTITEIHMNSTTYLLSMSKLCDLCVDLKHACCHLVLTQEAGHHDLCMECSEAPQHLPEMEMKYIINQPNPSIMKLTTCNM